MERRKFISASAAASVGIIACKNTNAMPQASNEKDSGLKGNINHSVCRWCYDKIPMEDFLKSLNELGIKAMDLTGPEDWPLMKKYGIHASMCWGAGKGILEGWNDPKLHDELIADYKRMIPIVAEAGYTNLICFSGNRNGMDDEEGLKNCAEGLKQIMPDAEKHGVVLQMELLNSKVDHADYMCDKSAWGVELCKQIGSEHFKLLYDIYHMQIMEGDIIRNIQDYHEYFGHYHTGGNPGRHEINETQELYYPAIMKAILDTGFKGYVAQEFIPTWDDKIAALKEGVTICDV
ncbi:hydroxypyruvate isomerase family protein [Pseudozobellia thermophila]|uniref:Hydroxypyruvate isomerase n=1 Tax=Pseudozobellia thermophila TaxID=192903 RepID=A0A1M6MLG7_9FLAO|nr:TIM barrel protein [Pseudozobellia thermophila]SHJ84299.1 hydroxypyruvate isomerase [Pseudozobellia thermophila]